MDEHVKSFWHSTDTLVLKNNKNIENKKYDVLIIGAGLVGLNTAYMLMNKGLNVAIIDSNAIGFGTRGYTNAKITFQHDLIYEYLNRYFGLNTAKNYYQAQIDGMAFYENVINGLNIKCDFLKDKNVVYSTDKNNVFDFRSEKEIYDILGINSRLIDEYNLDFPIQIGLEVDNQYNLNPIKYLYSLAKILEEGGIDIYENVTALDIDLSYKPYNVMTSAGNVFADKVVMANHFPLKKVFGLFFIKMAQERSYTIACKTKVKPFTGMYINIDKETRSVRFYNTNKQNVLLVSGGNHPVGKYPSKTNPYDELEQYLIKYFSKYEILSKWSTQDCMSHDRIPFIGSVNSKHKNIYVATGFNKWGMTNSAVSAIIIANSILNNNNLEFYDDIFNPSRHLNLNITSITRFGKGNFNSFIGLSKRVLYHSGDDLSNIKPNTGTVISSGAVKLGVYFDGNVYHCVKITCTHLGCEVKFNQADLSWDCQCHGSRFNIYGDILTGPATKKLKYAKVNKEDL